MKLAELLPSRLRSPAVVDFEEAMQLGVDGIVKAYDELLAQFTAGEADTLLPLWECAYGIPADPTKPLTARRAAVQAKMRGTGTATVDVIRRTAESFGGSCEVIEQASLYRFWVWFLDSLPDWAAVRKAVSEIQPAHLQAMFGFKASPMAFPNSERLLLRNFMLSFRFSNGARRPILLDGRRTLGGGWLLNQAFRGVELRKFGVGLKVTHSETLTGTLTAEAKRPLNGTRKLDGSWKLNGGITTEVL